MTAVSVIIPNYNHAPFLRRRIQTVLGQTWRDFEVILMDDCSTDDSRRIIHDFQGHPQVRIFLNDENSGSTFKQWNKGVRHAKGDFIWFAESDDLAEPELLERVLRAMQAHDCGVGCCESWLLHGDGEPAPDNLEPHFRAPPRRELWMGNFVADGPTICIEDMLRGNPMPNASAVVFRRDLFEAVGGADETMCQVGDRMLWIQMLRRSRLAHVGDRLNYFRCHDRTVRSKRSSSARVIAEVYSAIRCICDNLDVPQEKLDEALEKTGAYFARASAERGVRLSSMIRACGEVADVDPHIWERLFTPWMHQRLLQHPRDLRRAASRMLKRGKGAA